MYQQFFPKSYITIGDTVEDLLKKINTNTINSYSKALAKLSPIEFTTLGCTISIILAQSLTPNEQNTIGNLLEMIGQILLTSYAQASVVNPNVAPITQCNFLDLEKEINKIRNLVFKLYQNQSS